MITRPDTTLIPWADTGDVIKPPVPEISTGFPHTNDKPTRQTMNWILNYTSNAVLYLAKRGIPDWDSATAYVAGDICRGTDGRFYTALLPSTNLPPSTNPVQWQPNNADWSVSSGRGQILNKPPIEYDAGNNYINTFAGQFRVYSPDRTRYLALVSSNGGTSIIDSSVSAIDTFSTVRVFSRDSTRSLSIYTPNGGDPTLNSSTGNVRVPATLQVFSPDQVRWLSIYLPNSNHPTLYSSTNFLYIYSRISTFGGGLYTYSPDSSRSFGIEVKNTGNPQLLSSTGATELPGQLNIMSGDFARNLNIQTPVGGHPTLSSSTGAIEILSAINSRNGNVNLYSPDNSIGCYISVPNGANPRVQSTTNVFDIYASVQIVQEGGIPVLRLESYNGNTILTFNCQNTGNPTLTSSSGTIAFGSNTQLGTTYLYGSFSVYSPDGARFADIYCGNGGDPVLESSTANLQFRAGQRIIFVSPGWVKSLGLIVPDNGNPTFTATTGVVSFMSPDGSAWISIAALPSSTPTFTSNNGGYYFYSSDQQRALQIIIQPGSAPQIESSTSIIVTHANLRVYSPDALRYWVLVTPNGGDPVMDSTTGMIRVNCSGYYVGSLSATAFTPHASGFPTLLDVRQIFLYGNHDPRGDEPPDTKPPEPTPIENGSWQLLPMDDGMHVIAKRKGDELWETVIPWEKITKADEVPQPKTN